MEWSLNAEWSSSSERRGRHRRCHRRRRASPSLSPSSSPSGVTAKSAGGKRSRPAAESDRPGRLHPERGWGAGFSERSDSMSLGFPSLLLRLYGNTF
ncbi:MAG: hypothetical protein MPK06_05460 [Alphaproteobacteria bacterium]|nr:hypothetical protein [Alphaproteobacteria bacterium]MDA8012863.1 hypothetical protein [Alphaproteobacteria bacterium]